MITAEMIQAAAQILKITEGEAAEYSREIPEHSLGQFRTGARGGGTIIMGPDLSYIRFGSMTAPIEALERYLSGERTGS